MRSLCGDRCQRWHPRYSVPVRMWRCVHWKDCIFPWWWPILGRSHWCTRCWWPGRLTRCVGRIAVPNDGSSSRWVCSVSWAKFYWPFRCSWSKRDRWLSHGRPISCLLLSGRWCFSKRCQMVIQLLVLFWSPALCCWPDWRNGHNRCHANPPFDGACGFCCSNEMKLGRVDGFKLHEFSGLNKLCGDTKYSRLFLAG